MGTEKALLEHGNLSRVRSSSVTIETGQMARHCSYRNRRKYNHPGHRSQKVLARYVGAAQGLSGLGERLVKNRSWSPDRCLG